MKFGPLQLMGLYKLVADKTLAQLDGGMLSQMAQVAGVTANESQIATVLESLQGEDLSAPLLSWATTKMQDGSIERWLGQPEPNTFFTRCPHCSMPFTISVDE